MRIISGILAGREIWTPRASGTRPAMGKTREALFSMLEARGLNWADVSVLDLFAGTGSLGFEAISRGAAQAVMVETSNSLIRAMDRNCKEFGIESKCALIEQDVLRFLSRKPEKQFQVVFVDPPYRHNFAARTIEKILTREWLAPNAYLICELEEGLVLNVPNILSPVAQRRFGQTLLQIWSYNEDGTLSGDI